MDSLTTDGKSVVDISVNGGKTFRISIVSQRACDFIISQSKKGKWKNAICALEDYIQLGEQIMAVGFQPYHAQLICVRHMRKSNEL